MENKTYFFAGILVLTLAASFLVFQQMDQGKETDFESISSEEVNRTADGTKYTVHPDELRQGCPGMDCIPSIDAPKYIDVEEASWMEPRDRLIGVEKGKESKAFPLKILSRHEIVNTKIDSEPIVVTYCPLCRSGVTYSREVNGEPLEFGVSGKLLDANLVMYDRNTESYWSQIGGEAVIGSLTGEELELKFSSVTTWEEWKQGHPDTKILSRNTGIYPASSYSSDPYSGYKQSERVGFGVNGVDEKLPAKELVHGIKIANSSKAYRDKDVKREEIIHDTLGGEPILIIQRPDDGTVTGYIRKDRDQKFSLEQNGLRDHEGQLWSFSGEDINGKAEMDRITPQGFYWFAWSKFHPQTKLYGIKT